MVGYIFYLFLVLILPWLLLSYLIAFVLVYLAYKVNLKLFRLLLADAKPGSISRAFFDVSFIRTAWQLIFFSALLGFVATFTILYWLGKFLN